ncbi:hypothetical protein FRB90_010331 [Tulasnella sp. 427]|nr:hypothetical protein FRB90_010331 [Tulasnella sp. 427]
MTCNVCSLGFGQALTRALLAKTKLHVVGTTSSGAENARNAILGSGSRQDGGAVNESSKGTKPVHEEGGYGGSTSGGYGGADEFGGDPQGNVHQQQPAQGDRGNSSTTNDQTAKLSEGTDNSDWSSRLTTLDMDVREEDAIAHAATTVKERFGSNEVRLVVNISGMLHAEKNLSAVSSDELLETFKINTFGHLLVYKHFSPLLPHKRQTFDDAEDPASGVLKPGLSGLVSLSARVGSIGDNERGGWYSYRSSKAALNQIIRTLSHELNRRSPQHPAFCIAYHPGTMRTGLSEPYTRGQTPENTKGLFEVDEAAEKLIKLMGGMTTEKSGGFWAYDGTRIPW